MENQDALAHPSMQALDAKANGSAQHPQDKGLFAEVLQVNTDQAPQSMRNAATVNAILALDANQRAPPNTYVVKGQQVPDGNVNAFPVRYAMRGSLRDDDTRTLNQGAPSNNYFVVVAPGQAITGTAVVVAIAQDAATSGLTNLDQQSVRRAFVTKVCWIIVLQFVLTAIFITLPFKVQRVADWMSKRNGLSLASLGVFVLCLIVLKCWKKVSRRVPINYLLLLTTTVSMAVFMTFMCFKLNPTVLAAAGIVTFGIMVTLTVYVHVTRGTVSSKCATLLILAWSVGGLILGVLIYRQWWLQVLVCCLVLFLLMESMFLNLSRLYGMSFHSYTIDDYIIAALDLYVNAMLSFWCLSGGCS